MMAFACPALIFFVIAAAVSLLPAGCSWDLPPPKMLKGIREIIQINFFIIFLLCQRNTFSA